MFARCATILVLCSLLAYGATHDGPGIHRMIVGKQALVVGDVRGLPVADGQVVGTWVSPDGKYVAAFIADDPDRPGAGRFVLLRSSGGKPVALAAIPDAAGQGKSPSPGEYVLPGINEDCEVTWSPDSKLIAVPAARVVVGGEGESSFCSIIVLTPLGARRATFDLPKEFGHEGRIVWSRDSRRLACQMQSLTLPPGETPKRKCGILVCDISRGVGETPVTQDSGSVSPVSWSDDGASLMYASCAIRNEGVQLREVRFDGSADSLIQDDYRANGLSWDGKLRVTTDKGLCVENLVSGETTTILKEFHWGPPRWTPDSRMLIYERPDELWDENHQRCEKTASIWLADIESGSFNHMCVVSDADPDVPPSFSADCLKMAYISNGRLRLAELAWRDLTVDEKLAAGIPLTEDEEKLVLTNNAKQIAAGLAMYGADNDGRYPSGDEFQTALLDYCRNKSIFFRPGTQDPIFQYFPLGNRSDIRDPGNTIMGMFDVGYGWQVILYADGHVIVQPK